MELKQAIEYLVSIGQNETVTFDDDLGNTYVNSNYKKVIYDYPSPIKTGTLTSVVDYVKAQIDAKGTKVIHVVNHRTVEVYSTLDQYQKRNCWLEATALVPDVICYGKYLDAESFSIALQSRFVPTEDRDILLKISGNIEESAIKTSVDDGVSQSVAVKTGVTTVSNVQVPKIVRLKPFRTFTEIHQPESDFVFRLSNGPSCALFEADGGAWKNQAIQDIARYLKEELGEMEGYIILA